MRSPVIETVVETAEWPVATDVLKRSRAALPASGLHALVLPVLKVGGRRQVVPRRCVLRFWFGGTDFF